ncbi:DUF4127 family protein [bacterium]|nr:DUF4127 family protein [bacterium]
MRIALIPLDSRPVNRLYPARLADLCGAIVHTPPRDLLGSLQDGADTVALARWLRDTVTGRLGGPGCNLAVFSWDALIYGGLIQSRQLDVQPRIEEVFGLLKEIDWRQVAGYCYVTVPRLGISVASSAVWPQHELVREYFINWGARQELRSAAERTAQLENQLGGDAVKALWAWRMRNIGLAEQALEQSYQLGLRHCHVAVEDNASTGPHLGEVEKLRQAYVKAKRDHPQASCTFFDGADEAACLLTARAISETRGNETRHLQLTVTPAVPGPDRYTGRFESHNLGDGLTFLSRFLNITYHYDAQELHWLVVHGVQPQPDLFTDPSEKVLNNPFLLPKAYPTEGNLLVTDLCACNGANPRLARHLAGDSRASLLGLVGLNTNFNALGISAAWLRLIPRAGHPASRRFLLERLADDLVYQAIARAEVVEYVRGQGLDPLDFSDAHPLQVKEALSLVKNRWLDWCENSGQYVLQRAGIEPEQARAVEFSFPWSRAFEIEAVAPALHSAYE